MRNRTFVTSQMTVLIENKINLHERLISYRIEEGDKMKRFNFIDEIDWKVVAVIAACVLGYAIITVI